MSKKIGLSLFLLVVLATRALSADLLVAAPTEAELRPLLALLQDKHEEQIASWHFWTGRLGEKTVVATRAEQDPLNACAATTLALRHFTPKLVLIASTARPHDPDLREGSVIFSTQFAAFDGFVSQRKKQGEGVQPTTWDILPHLPIHPDGERAPLVHFPADQQAVQAGIKTLEGASLGTLGSAYQVNREADRIAWLRLNWMTTTEDFVSAHIAGVAYLFKVPVAGLVVVDSSGSKEAETKVGQSLVKWVEALP